MFEQGELRLVMLSLISEKPRHGYEIIKAIEDALAGAYAPSPGVVYPTLTLLEELGYVTLQSETGGKKLFAITDEGKKHLEENADTVAAAFARANDEGGNRKAVMRVRRAMENLRTAVKLRASESALSDEAIDKITAAIDAAAAAVERA
jgi:DNA-binding PadR family transcriptional regulator